MKILIICNNAFVKGNGLSVAIQNQTIRLRQAGQEVRIASVANPEPDGMQADYPLKHFIFPIFEPLIAANGFCYASLEKDVLTEAISWADVVHLEEAMPLQVMAVKIARRLGKPCVASYHLFAENIMANLGMGVRNPLNRIVTRVWKNMVYDKCSHIHCPSPAVKEYLQRAGFGAQLHVFSNGLEAVSSDTVPAQPQTDPYLVLCTGRLSNEKSQTTLLDAMRHSRHASEIQLVFAGKGPKLDKYAKLADRLVRDGVLKYAPTFNFYTREQLAAIARKSYLYIHCAWVEVEGLSCLEAIREGTVPVIAEGPCVAASQFALDDRSRFPVRDSRALASKIDWWIEHPEERLRMGRAYADSVSKYSAADSNEAMIAMYRAALGK